MAKRRTSIVVCCYNLIEKWESKKNALDFYEDAMRNTEGSEMERYAHIYFDIKDGKAVCTDGVSDYARCLAEGLFGQFDNPNNTRDYNDEIYYPIN